MKTNPLIAIAVDEPTITRDGDVKLTFTFLSNSRFATYALCDDLRAVTAKGNKIAVTAKQHREKRSLDANGYLWKLCELLAVAASTQGEQTTSVEVYQMAVKEVGVSTVVPIRNDAVERWVLEWEKRGIGWFAEVINESKHDGYSNVKCYYGSSSYDTKEMSRLIDNVVQDCVAVGVPTETPEKLALMKSEWSV